MNLSKEPTADIQFFYKNFSLFNCYVQLTSVSYSDVSTTYFDDLVKEAKELIFKNRLSLSITANKVIRTIFIRQISELDRLDNSFGTITERLTELQKQL